MGLSALSPAALLALHAQVAEELRARGITRSANGPTGDLAEYLFCKAFGWTQSSNSEANIDAIRPDGTRYQIKGRSSRGITNPASCQRFATLAARILISSQAYYSRKTMQSCELRLSLTP